MADTTKIQWADATWNIARGCSKVDEDCKYCYMYRESMNGKRFEPKEVVKTKTVFTLPLKLKEPARIFTSSLTDVFHEGCDSFRDEMWDIIRRCPQHTFLILTKRPERISKCLPADWGPDGWPNVWLGTSVGSQGSIHRITQLVEAAPAVVKFLSLEPLHGPVNLYWNNILNFLDGINWVIVGGESGNENGKYKYRPCRLDWIENIINDCKENNVPVFVKQMGTYLSKQMGLTDRHGGNMEEWPENLQVRQFPTKL